MRWVALALLLSPLAALPAGAQGAARVELTWSAPAGCPSQRDLEADVARRLGRPLAGTGPALRALAEVEPVEGGFRLVLVTELEGEAGTRVLEAPRCEELASAASVIVALLADPHADATPAPAPAPAPPPPEPPAPEPAVEDSEATSAEAEEGDDDEDEEEREEPEPASPPIVVRVAVRPELIADLGTMPALGVGPALSLGLRLDRTAIELSANYLPPNHVERGERQLGVVKMWSASLGVCHALGQGPTVGPCLRAEYGRMTGEGDEVRTQEHGTGMFAAVLLGLRFDAPVLPALTLCAEIAAGLPLARTLFTVGGVGVAHESAAVIGRVRTGAELRF